MCDLVSQNTSYFQYRAVLNIAKELASKKDRAGLEEFSQNEVEKFMSLWKSNTEFREEYEKRNLPYLFNRQLSKDGRMRNPDEKPPVLDEVANLDSSIRKENSKKEIVHPKPQQNLPENDSLDLERASKENYKQVTGSTKGIKIMQPIDSQNDRKTISKKDEPDLSSAAGLILEDISTAKDEADAVLLKEKRREEEIAKAKLAMERKKRQAEKTQAKAAAKAQKEAEKKLKEREKKARRKAATSSALTPEGEPSTQMETASGADEMETEMNEALVQQKGDETKEKPRQRKKDVSTRSKGKPYFPKSALKKKQSFPSWVWVGLIVLLVLVLLSIIAYYRVL